MKGYKTVNGGYITGKEIQQRQRKFIKELKQARIEKRKEEQRKEEINFVKYLQEKKEQKELQEAQEQKAINKSQLLAKVQKNNLFKYKQFLILWDVLTDNYYQIEADLKRSKINIDDVKRVFDYIDNFNSDIICSYWKEILS